jgi:uncharacterized membrane protein YesL
VASRADPAALPASPTLRGALRSAATDFYFHSWRLLPANVLWAAVSLLLLGVAVLVPGLIVLLPLAALPIAGIFRMATRIVRGESVSFWDGLDAWRGEVRPALALGAGLLVAALILGFNVISGLLTGTVVGWAFATLAFWGLVATWLYAWVAWPILMDSARAAMPARRRLRLAALLLLAHPVRLAGLGLILFALCLLSVAAIVPLLTVTVSFAALVSTRMVLPAADRFEARYSGAAPVRAVESGPVVAESRPVETAARP